MAERLSSGLQPVYVGSSPTPCSSFLDVWVAKMLEDPFVSVIIPAFNEEDNIGFVLDGVHGVLKGMGLPYEIIVVNDGSFDKTAEIAKEHDVVLINNGKNRGKGHALRRGFRRARGGLVVTMDADGSHRPGDIRLLLQPLLNGDDVDSVVGVRFHNHTGRSSTTRLHLLGNKIMNAVILFLTGRYISDTQSGFRAFRRQTLEGLVLRASGFEIESEILIKLLRKGCRLREVPIDCRERISGDTRIESFGDGFRILKMVLRTFFLE